MLLLDSYGKSTNIVVRDMNGVEVEPGDLVEVQHCIGRYGQTETVRGTLAKVNHYGVYLIFDRPYNSYGRHGCYTYQPGTEVQFAISHKNGVFSHEHHDFEHGHTTHMKKL